jgi:signal transduction histidine kinase
LVTNAIKYCPDTRKPHIQIVGRNVSKGYQVDITDNGMGIPSEAKERIFRIFERVDSDKPGDGIGLFLIKSLLLKYGGNIHLKTSKANAGSTFRILFPVDPSNYS